MALRLNGSTSGYVELNAPAVAGSQSLTIPYGILQVVSTTKTDTFTTTATAPSPAAVTGLYVTLTPTSTSSKILVAVDIGAASSQTNDGGVYFFLNKNGSILSGATGDTASSRVVCTAAQNVTATYNHNAVCFSYLDSPNTTSSVTYQVYLASTGSTVAVVNRNGYDYDSAGYPRTISTITAYEVVG